MQIQVLGTGCATCKSLFEITKKAVQEMGLKDTVEYITDITKMIEMGIMTSPVLAVNGKVIMTGFSRDIEKIKELITFGINSADDKEPINQNKGCSCGGGCC